MDSFTIELVSNASGELFPDNTLSSFTNFLPEQVNLEAQWEVANSGISYPSMYQNLTEGKFKFFDKKLSKSTSTYSIEPGLYKSITDIVEAMNTLIQERNNHNETCITVKVSRGTQKVVVMLANDNSGPMLKNSFHSIPIDLRDTSGEKIPFVSVGITRLVLMFRKASNIHF